MIPTEAQIREILSGPVKKTRNHLVCTCWQCGKEFHYYFNLKNGFSDCKKCSRGWNLFQFLQGWNALHLLQGSPVDTTADLKLLESVEQEKQTVVVPNSTLPPGFKQVYWNSDSIYTDYLKKRKYTEQDFLLYRPGYTKLIERLNNFIVIPIYNNWEVKGYIARNLDGNSEKRYQNKKDVPFAALLDGIDECTVNTKNLILVEGHFDKISVTTELGLHHQEEFKSVCTFGKKFSEAQMNLIEKTNVENLFFLYDMRDAINEIKFFGNKLKQRFNVFGCYKKTTLDPGAMQRKQLLSMLATATPIENYTYNVVQFNVLR